MEDAEGAFVLAFIRDASSVRSAQAEQQRAAGHIARLHTIIAALGAAIDVAAVTAVILSVGAEKVGAASVALLCTVDNGRHVEVLGEIGRLPAPVNARAAAVGPAHVRSAVTERRRFSIDADLPICHAVRTRSALWALDMTELRVRYPALGPVLADTGWRALVCLPLVSRGETIGGLALAFTSECAFDSHERGFLAAFADQCALALDRAQLYEEALAARDIANRAVMMRDEFLSVVAHDLGNPMNAVGLWAHLMLAQAPSGATGDAVRATAGKIGEGVKRMAFLLDDLGDLASIDAGHLAIQKQDIDLNAMVTEAVDALAPLCIEKRITLNGAAPAVQLACDSRRVQQVLGNLVGNAIKFTPEEGSITIEVVASGGELVFSVADTGPGIAETLRPHVFERYWRGRTRDLTKGVGLGLFISKGIVETHGGRIWVESAVGGGSRFCFTIPLS